MTGAFPAGPPVLEAIRPHGAFSGTRVLAGQRSGWKTGPCDGLRTRAPALKATRPRGGSRQGSRAMPDPKKPSPRAREAQLHAELVSPSRDFNLMTRRSRAQGEIAVCRESFTAHGDGRSMLLFCADGAWQIGDDCLLQQGDHLLLQAPANIPVRQMGANSALLRVQIMLSE